MESFCDPPCQPSTDAADQGDESCMVCGIDSREPIMKQIRGAINTLSEHAASHAKDISSLQQDSMRKDDEIHHISKKQSELQHIVQEEVIPHINNLSSKVQKMQEVDTTKMTGTFCQHTCSEPHHESLSHPSASGSVDEYEKEDKGRASFQSMLPVIEKHLGRIEASLKLLSQEVDGLKEAVSSSESTPPSIKNLVGRLEALVNCPPQMVDPSEEVHDTRATHNATTSDPADAQAMHSQAGAVSTKDHPLLFSTPKRGHLARNASTTSSGIWSITEENPDLDDVTEDSIMCTSLPLHFAPKRDEGTQTPNNTETW